MQLRISRHKDKPHALRYLRDDGTETWMHADDFFVVHDLSHYALEKSLGYTTSFMGMLNNGMEIKDFEDRTKRKAMPLTEEAVFAENMANLFLMERMQGQLPDFNETLSSAFNPMGTSAKPVQLSEEELDAVRNLLDRLLDDWRNLPDGKTLTLEF